MDKRHCIVSVSMADDAQDCLGFILRSCKFLGGVFSFLLVQCNDYKGQPLIAKLIYRNPERLLLANGVTITSCFSPRLEIDNRKSSYHDKTLSTCNRTVEVISN